MTPPRPLYSLILTVSFLCPLALPNASAASSPPPQLLKEFPADSFVDLLDPAIVQDQRLWFTADDGRSGREPWTSDGTPTGTRLLKDTLPGRTTQGPRSGNPIAFWPMGSSVWFQVDDSAHPWWQSNGQTTQPIAALNSTLKRIQPPNTILAVSQPSPRLLFAIATNQGAELWQSTAQQPTPQRFYRFPSSAVGFPPQLFTVAGAQTFFAAANAQGTQQLWRTDGTSKGTIALKSLNPAADPFTVWQNRIYFQAETPQQGWELWTSDGTIAGTQLIKDVLPGPGHSAPRLLTGIKQQFFWVANGPQGEELWVTEGQPNQTRRVKRLTNRPSFRAERNFGVVKNRLFFSTVAADGKAYLWLTDGTEAGTRQLTPQGLFSLTHLTVVGDRVFFSGTGPDGSEPWVSDGTVQGTRQIKDLAPGTTVIAAPCAPPPLGERRNCPPPTPVANSSDPTRLTAFRDRLYFIAHTADKTQLWRTDGSDRGTEAILDLAPAVAGRPSPRILPFRDRLLVTGYQMDKNRLQLWSIRE